MKCLGYENPLRQKVGQWLPGTKGQEKRRVTANSYGFSPLCENALGLQSGDGYTTL